MFIFPISYFTVNLVSNIKDTHYSHHTNTISQCVCACVRACVCERAEKCVVCVQFFVGVTSYLMHFAVKL